MANLEFCDKHNMVTYLKKPTGSEGFQEIVDFLNEIHIRFALTKNPTIYVSLIEKSWHIATVRTVDIGEQEITATVDGKEFTITRASVRRNLQLADVDGFSGELTPLFPTMLAIQAEEGKGSGHPSEPQSPLSTAQPIHEEPIPNFTSEPIPNVPDEAIYEEWDDRVEKDTTTAASLDAVQASGGSPGANKLRGVPLLSLGLRGKVESLEADLKQTKQVYGAAYTKLIIKRRMIEEIDQDVGVTLVTPTHSQEDQPEDQLGVFSAAKVLADVAKNIHTYTRRRRAISTGSGGISTGSILFSTAKESVSTASASMPVTTAGTVQEVNKDKGNGIMTESELKQTKTKLQQRQERAGYEAAVRLKEQLDEEERQMIAKVHEEASSFNIKEWENIQATIEADEELTQRIQAEEREKYSEVEKARLLAELINQRKRYFAQQRAKERRNKPLT
ncbi:hypothetical protein Tco_1337731 [Tanacetum coccineum]